jgi:PPOX class probable F420-dependent enzyme
MAKMDPEAMARFLDERHVAHLTTLRPDGSPHTAPVWYEYRDGSFAMFTWTATRKVAHLRNDARVSLSIASVDEPYRYVSVGGRAELREQDVIPAAESIARRYRGERAPAFLSDLMSWAVPIVVALTPEYLMTYVADPDES